MKASLLLLIGLMAVGLAAEPLTLELYNDKGLMGKITTTLKGESELSSTTELSWNNRRLTMNEDYVLNKDGYPTKVTISGISAFGAPVNETFEWQDGKAKWSSRADDGEVELTKNAMYTAVDALSTDVLVRALLKAPFNQVELLPSGKAQLNEVDSVELGRDSKKTTVKLYAITGLGMLPTFLWSDKNGHLFALSMGGIKGIRAGYSMDDFEQLKARQDKAEENYYTDLSKELTLPLVKPLLIQNANVVDVENKTVLKKTDVLIQDGKIRKVAKNIGVPKNATVIQAKGKTLIPGLWDMHGHMGKTSGFNYLAAGITSVRDIGNSPSNMEEIEKLYRDKYVGTRLYKAGFIDRQSEYSAGTGKTVSTLEEAKAAVDWYADRGYIQIKTYSSMDPKWMKSLAEHIHKRGLRLSGHIPAFMSAEQAVDAGFDEIQHINMLFLNFLGGDTIDTRQRLRFSLIGEKAKDLDLNSKPVQDFVDKLAKKGIEVDLTVSTFMSLLLTRDKQLDPEYADIAHHFPPGFQRGLRTATMKIDSEEMDESYKAAGDALLKMTKLLFDKGVPIIPGTDMYGGVTLLRELELYSKAGIPNIDVIRIGTLESARVVGNASNTGSIAEGKDADLILIDGDPIKNIGDIRKASLVIQGDRAFQPEKIYQSLGIKPFAKAVGI